MTRRKGIALLTNLELEVMRVIWAAEARSLRAREVVDAVNEGRERPLAYNTIQTVLTILKDKGYVRVRPGPGRAHLHSARIGQAEANASMVGDLLSRLFDGRVEPLLVQLVEDEAIGRSELGALRRFIDSRLEDDPEGGP